MEYSEFDDWGIQYCNMHIASTVPTEEELLKICQVIFQFHQKNPSLLVGIMDMTVFNLPYYIIAQYRCIQSHTNRYLLRTKKATLNELESSLSLSKSESFATDFNSFRHSRHTIVIEAALFYPSFLELDSTFPLIHAAFFVSSHEGLFFQYHSHSCVDRFSTFHFAFRG